MSKHSIKTSILGLDHYRFGDYVSGLVDGEGHFGLMLATRESGRLRPVARFNIGLRADDRPILEAIKTYFGCGLIKGAGKRYSIKHNPINTYHVSSPIDLIRTIIPHFEEHPLLAKKSGDYRIWKTAVELMVEVGSRKITTYPGGRSGHIPIWKDKDIDLFSSLTKQIKEHRRFKNAVTNKYPPTVIIQSNKEQEGFFY